MYELTTDLASAVTNEQEQIVSFSLTAPTEVTLVLENTQPSEAQLIVEELAEKEPAVYDALIKTTYNFK